MNLRILLLLLILPGFARGEAPFDRPCESPVGSYSARFSRTEDSGSKSSGTALKITDRTGRVVFADSVPDRVAIGARWTEDGQYLVIPTTSGGGHSPWHVHVYLFSLAQHAIRLLDDSVSPPIISSEIWCQAPDIIILVGHDFSHDIAAPDDPILLRYKASELWKKLK